jgi:3-dehydroquinate dehydratase / shikimate dehydrogenase
MKPLLCVTVTAPTTAELRRRRDAVVDADLVELRLDSVRDPDVAGALAGRTRPVVVTCRPQWEGGAFSGAEDDRHRLLRDALAAGAEYVDVEWRAGFHDLLQATGGRRIVLSSHDYDMVPIDLVSRLHAMRSTGAEVIKLAMKLTCLADAIRLLEISAASPDAAERGGLVILGMGEYGIATRVLPGRFGSLWTYAGGLKDVGQIGAATLTDDYHFRRLDDATQVYGLVGQPVAHSVSPAMFNAAFRATEVNAIYLPLPAANADDFVRFGRAFGIRGASVTVPFKVSLYDRVDEAYSVARRVGAINTIKAEEGRWIGGNTDASGFLQPLQDRVRLDGLRTSVLGAGGAARAVAVALASTGAAVTLHARDRQQADQVAMLTSSVTGPWPPAPDSWDLLVNCTPVGMHPRIDDTPIPADRLTGRYVYDLVYNPPATRLLRDAARMGCQTIGGLDMLVAQAHEQFQWWTGTRPPVGIMREAALKRLAEFAHDEDHVV